MKITNNLDDNNLDKLCVICWVSEGKTILCVNCKFKYCPDCVKKINSKCCICHRQNSNSDYIPNYSFNDSDFEIGYYPTFYNTFSNIFKSFLIASITSIGVVYLFIWVINSIF